MAAAAVRRASTKFRAVDYLRVSTEEQVKGYGIAYTGKRTKRHIATKGWRHARTYADEGFSGSLEAHERPDLNRLMQDARQVPRPFDVVCVAEERAIGRAGRAFWPWVWELEDLGVFVAIVKGDYDNTTAEGRSRMRKAADRAEDERETIRERTQGGLQEKAEDGGYIGGKVPYGYRVINRGVRGESRLVIDDHQSCPVNCTAMHEAECLRDGRQCYVETRDWEEVAKSLNARGYRRRNGQPWGYHAARQQILSDIILEARQLFRGSHYVQRDADGKTTYGEPVTIKLDPIFTPDEVAELRSANQKPPRKPSTFRVYTLSGQIHSPCGKRYVGGGKGRRERQYRCQGRTAAYPGATTCECAYLRAEPIEQEAWKRIQHLLGDLGQLKAMAEDWLGYRSGSRVNFAERIAELDKQIAAQQKAVNITISVTAKQVAIEEELSEEESERRLAEVIAPLQQELTKLKRDRTDVASWQEESDDAEDRLTQLVQLAEMAQHRLHNMPLDKQQELMTVLNCEVTLIADLPQGRKGQPCALASWFSQRNMGVPLLTENAWEKVAPLIDWQPRNLSPRTVLAGILYKVRTDTPWKSVPSVFGSPATLQTYWTRWRRSGFWERAMEALADEPWTALPSPPSPKLTLRCLIEPQVLLESEGRPVESAAPGSPAARRPRRRPPPAARHPTPRCSRS
ncbi:recombinase family protein [Streptomyces sp. DSM 42041]|uniref:Recombinase family protein n=1 Tax=Streptomyces hazeniae TaxID=3075538 RepID=A0ABU2NN40_9ACTN|nr:recombinase family protein [Streptomyces sp. DSM 42041]MDT0378395.1 recombinase family protein [Streptomyces sp. DSM 42041]